MSCSPEQGQSQDRLWIDALAALGLLLTKPKADSYRPHLEQLLFVSAAVLQDKVRVFGLGPSPCMWPQ